jgi:NADPH:quinone reductase-like Zn-dependent oxidoreductase
MTSSHTAPTLPQQQTALVIEGPGKLVVQHDVPVPALAADQVLVKTAAVAINPADAKMLDFSPASGSIHGHDFAGTVVALGDEAEASGRFSVGDRVAGYLYGNNKAKPTVGAFAEYATAYADVLLKIPDNMTFTDAAGLGLGVATAATGLFRELKVPGSLDATDTSQSADAKDDREFVLVAGGSTATGTRALQLCKL